MKLSKYNTILDVTPNSSVLYNSKEDKCLVFNTEKKHLFSMDPSMIASIDPAIYNDLLNINAIVESDKNELAEVILKSRQIDSSEKEFKLIINPTMNCNFKCWYCYESHIPGSKLSNNTIDRIYKLIENTLTKNKKLERFVLSFFGGEPLMYYNKTTRQIIDFLREKYSEYPHIQFSIHFTSNAYILNNEIISHLTEREEYKHFQITLDGGREEHNKVRDSGKKEGSYDKIIDSIKKLVSNKIDVLTRVNYTAQNIDSTREIIDDLKDIPEDFKKYLNVGYFRVWQDDTKVKVKDKVDTIYADYHTNEISVNQNDLYMDNLNNPCYADKKNELVVNFNGDIYKCTARDFSQENKYGTLDSDGNVDWIEDKLNEWENIKIQSKACQNCRILPLCGGGCHQVNLENKGLNTCQIGINDQQKDDIIMYRLSSLFVNEN
ncbi:MAG: radical SAM protein [Chryseobacterium sp.]|jgi:uncharacterized protein|uniref:radical SAM/SPASM domain-containing protein n=1 Tax=Chryseobacterium sp. TaxID=1871047 RepID=UPI002817BFF7|nr:radical SAM protein [Chryseobacterium sp.]MDR2235308.1 radical SAM protein [Chryseobacterium sp.]